MVEVSQIAMLVRDLWLTFAAIKPTWLSGTNLTRFDVPGLDNQIWHDSAGIACADITQMAGCVLGGGVAINAGLWWKVSYPGSPALSTYS